MSNIRTNITKRKVKQKNREGEVFKYDRYYLHYKDPATGKRRQRRFETRKEAEAARNDLIKNADAIKRRKGGEIPTLKEAVEYWLECKKNTIQTKTHRSYTQCAYDYILGPVYKTTAQNRRKYAISGKWPKNLQQVEMLGSHRKVDEITTAEIRMWYQRILTVSTTYNARLSKKHLSSIFRLIEEDYEVRLARMPTKPGRPHRKKPRELLNDDQIQLVLNEAQRDKKWGVYYAFLFLTGVRPGEMLGLLWSDVDLARGYVVIRRSQLSTGEIKDLPKTDAGIREIPLNSLLLEMMREWKTRCPEINGKLYRVFPSQQNERKIGGYLKPGSDGGLTLSNFRMRVWYPLLERLGIPRIAIYATRHMAISHLQSQGVEIGTVAKIAGHASPQVTLQYYTHAVRELDGVMDKLGDAYSLKKATSASESGVQL